MTILSCINAEDKALPGYYIFKGKRALLNYLSQCKEGATMSMQGKAWMTMQLFSAWLEHFKQVVPGGVSPEHRHLLILDGHGSHTAIELVEKARSWGIDIVTLPSHTSHRLQPLDVSIFKPFKTHFKKERALWRLRNPNSPV